MGFSPVQKNYAEAVRWFAKAAEADDAQAQVYLAECYYFELGVPKDVERARALLERAKQQGKKSSRLTFSDTPISIDYNTLKPNTAPSGVSYSFTITYNATETPQTRLFLKRYAGVYFFRNLQDRDSAAAAYSELRNKLYELDKEALNNDGTAEEQRDRFTRRMGECNTALGTFESKIRSASRR
jgi:TPR repeat protein